MTEDEIILTHILKCRPVDLVINKPVLTPAQQKRFDAYRRRRAKGEPLQYILGTCNFMGLELKVNPSVLVPRPETEQLVDAALKEFAKLPDQRKIRVLDLGTGSGNIAIALAKFLPHAHVISVDVSAVALKIAQENAKRHKVNGRIKFVMDDFLLSLQAETEKMHLFDLVISNPPYIPTMQLGTLPRDVQQEPFLALDGGDDGLSFYPVIIKYSPCLIRGGGCLMMEFGDGQAEAIRHLFAAQSHFSTIKILKDLAGRDRIVKAFFSTED